jgi:hypothetical protein
MNYPMRPLLRQHPTNLTDVSLCVNNSGVFRDANRTKVRSIAINEKVPTARTRRCSPSSPPGSSSCLLELRPQGDHVVRDLGALGGGKELLRRAT